MRSLVAAWGFAFSGHDDGTIRQWDLSSGELLRTLRSANPGAITTLTHGARCVFAATNQGSGLLVVRCRAVDCIEGQGSGLH